jgi:hypothetical protein
VVASNVIRNAGLHLQAPSWRANALILAGITSAHGWLRLDVTDPRTSLGGGRLEFDVPKPRFHEDLAGNGLHFVLLVLSLALALIWRTREDGGRVRGYALALVVGFGLFCAYLKWQPWGSRLQLPLFVLGSALIAVIASRPAGTTPARLIAGGLCLAALPWLLLNETRPLVGQATVLNTSRVDLYFLSRPAVAGAYQSAALRVRQTRCREVGLALGLDDWEYPFWVLLDSHSAQGRSLTHVLPRSQSSTDGRPAHTAASVPCALIALDSARNVNWAAIDRAYVEKWRATPVTVFSGPVGR